METTSEPSAHGEQPDQLDAVVKEIKQASGTDEHWLRSFKVQGSQPTSITHRGQSYPGRDSNIDLVLYTLTSTERFNNAASLLRTALARDNPILVHGLSGAGKTRAILDVLANQHVSQSWRYGIYFDFANLTDQIPRKNYTQVDVQTLRLLISGQKGWTEERKADSELAQHYFKCLILARVVLLHDLTLAGWNQTDCLWAQLGTGTTGTALGALSARLLGKLVRMEAWQVNIWFSDVHRHLFVAVDEANVAMIPRLGSYPASTRNNATESRSFISPCYTVLSNTCCVLAGTKMSLGELRNDIVSQDFERQTLDVPPFNSFAVLDTVKMKEIGKQFFGLGDDELDSANLGILTGRCRFFMGAIKEWLINEDDSLDAAIASVIRASQESTGGGPFHSVEAFVEKYAANDRVIEFVSNELLTSFIKGNDSTMVYARNGKNLDEEQEAIRNVVDSSVAATSPRTYHVTLKEPLVVFALIKSLVSHAIWKPVDTMLRNLFANKDNPSTMGFIFEYVLAYLLIPNFEAVMAHLKQKEKYKAMPDWMVDLKWENPLHFKVEHSHYSAFSREPQQSTVCFPPSKPSGPDFLAWLIARGTYYRLLVQCKLYKDPLTDALTKTATRTLKGKGVKILFTGIGAEGIQPVKVTKSTVTLAIQLADLADCDAVSELGAVYVAKYGESWDKNLDDYNDDDSMEVS